jgi:hypothetical protein
MLFYEKRGIKPALTERVSIPYMPLGWKSRQDAGIFWKNTDVASGTAPAGRNADMKSGIC